MLSVCSVFLVKIPTSAPFYAIRSRRRAFSVHFVRNHAEFDAECAHKHSHTPRIVDGENEEAAATQKSVNQNQAIWVVLLLLLVCFASSEGDRERRAEPMCAWKKDTTPSSMLMENLVLWKWLHKFGGVFSVGSILYSPSFFVSMTASLLHTTWVQQRLRVPVLHAAVQHSDGVHILIQFDVRTVM